MIELGVRQETSLCDSSSLRALLTWDAGRLVCLANCVGVRSMLRDVITFWRYVLLIT